MFPILKKATPPEVGLFYDQFTRFFELIWGDSLHVGYWPNGTAGGSIAQAQERFTDLLIGKTKAQAGQHFLDVGCGTGRPAIHLAEVTGCRVTGITISHTQVEVANRQAADAKLATRVSFQLADAMTLPFPAASFDAAWAFESLFHMPSRGQVLGEVGRVLRPGGRLAIADIVCDHSVQAEEAALISDFFKMNSVSTSDQYRSLIREAGFELEEMLDVTANIKETFLLTSEIVARRTPELRQTYGEDFVAMVRAVWPRLTELCIAHLTYVVITARKR